jgi:hypothetical protein
MNTPAQTMRAGGAVRKLGHHMLQLQTMLLARACSGSERTVFLLLLYGGPKLSSAEGTELSCSTAAAGSCWWRTG